MKPNQLMFDSLEGKTIKRVFSDCEYRMLLVFDDQTFCSLSSYECDEEVTLKNGDFSILDWGKYAVELLVLGIITQEAFDRYKTHQAEQAAEYKEYRKRRYDALKSEFESK